MAPSARHKRSTGWFDGDENYANYGIRPSQSPDLNPNGSIREISGPACWTLLWTTNIQAAHKGKSSREAHPWGRVPEMCTICAKEQCELLWQRRTPAASWFCLICRPSVFVLVLIHPRKRQFISQALSVYGITPIFVYVSSFFLHFMCASWFINTFTQLCKFFVLRIYLKKENRHRECMLWSAYMVTVTARQPPERWDQTWRENVSGRGGGLLTDLEQKPGWQVVSGTYERTAWRGIRESSQIHRVALISWRAISVKRVLNIMKHCSGKLWHRPGGFSLTKHFPVTVTTLIWQLLSAAVLSHRRNPHINISHTSQRARRSGKLGRMG